MNTQTCIKCSNDTPDMFPHCPDCMKEAGIAAWQIEAASTLLAVTKVMNPRSTDKERTAALQKMLTIAEGLKRGAHE